MTFLFYAHSTFAAVFTNWPDKDPRTSTFENALIQSVDLLTVRGRRIMRTDQCI